MALIAIKSTNITHKKSPLLRTFSYYNEYLKAKQSLFSITYGG